MITTVNSSMFVSEGASVSLPALTTYTSTGDSGLEADGVGSTLALPLLAKASASTGLYALLSIEALEGGQILLPLVTEFECSQDSFGVSIESEDSGSLIDLSGLTSLVGGANTFAGSQCFQPNSEIRRHRRRSRTRFD